MMKAKSINCDVCKDLKKVDDLVFYFSQVDSFSVCKDCEKERNRLMNLPIPENSIQKDIIKNIDKIRCINNSFIGFTFTPENKLELEKSINNVIPQHIKCEIDNKGSFQCLDIWHKFFFKDSENIFFFLKMIY